MESETGERETNEASTGATESEPDSGFTGDGFYIPVPDRPTRRKGVRRVSRRLTGDERDYSLFTLDYAFRKIGGRKAAIQLASLFSASNPKVQALMAAWYALTPGQQKHSPKLLEALCVQNGIDPSDFLGMCTAVAHKNQLETASLLVTRHLGEIVSAGVEMAKRPEGIADRKLIYEHSHFTEPKTGIAIQVNQSNNSGGTALPEFKSVSEIALQAIARAALPPSTLEGEDGTIDGELVTDDD